VVPISSAVNSLMCVQFVSGVYWRLQQAERPGKQ
jgi:hypothetical protein